MEKDGQHKVVMGCSTGQHMPHIKVIIIRLAVTACRGEHIPIQETGRIMKMTGEKINGDHPV